MSSSSVVGAAADEVVFTDGIPEGTDYIEGSSAVDRRPVVDAFGALSGVEPIRVKKNVLPKGRQWEAGMGFPVEMDDGEQTVLYIGEMKGAWVTLTRDHPLAGQTMDFEVDEGEIVTLIGGG